MKKIILLIAILALVFPAAERAEAQVGVSIDFFYNNLTTGGNWIEAGDYGYCWQPTVAVSNTRWRPYSDGYWAYTDVGWTWVSYEDFGWATYHYGRWARLRDQGWVWVPGREWGPAWVSWRTGGDYVGWAPLPPRYGGGRGAELVYEGRAISNTVDIDFDIGPAYYNFVDVRYIGEPVLRERIFEPTQNITYINRTVNVTNITYNNSTVYNYGPDYNRLSAYSTRPIRRMTLERPANVDYTVAAQSGGLTKVQGDKLIVAAPPVIQKPAQQQQVAPPKVVKTRIAKPEVETGWMGISDPKAKAELQQKIKKEDPKSVPPPQVKPTNPALLSAAPSPSPATAGSSPAAVAASTEPASANDRKGRRRDRKNRDAKGQPDQPAASQASSVTSPDTTATPGAPANQNNRGKGRKNRGAKGQPDQPAETPASGVASPDTTATSGAAANQNNREKGRNKRGAAEPQSQPPSPSQAEAVTPEANAASVQQSNERKGRGKRDTRPRPTVEPAATPLSGGLDGGVNRGSDRSDRSTYVPPTGDNEKMANRGGKKGERDNVPPAVDRGPRAGGASQGPSAQENPRKVERQTRQAPPREAAPRDAQVAQQRGDGKPAKGKKGKKSDEAPAPSPTP